MKAGYTMGRRLLRALRVQPRRGRRQFSCPLRCALRPLVLLPAPLPRPLLRLARALLALTPQHFDGNLHLWWGVEVGGFRAIT